MRPDDDPAITRSPAMTGSPVRSRIKAMARPPRLPATCAVHSWTPVSVFAASNCPEAKGNTTVSPRTAGADTPVTPDWPGMPDTVHSTRPSLARTAQPVASRPTT